MKMLLFFFSMTGAEYGANILFEVSVMVSVTSKKLPNVYKVDEKDFSSKMIDFDTFT